MKLSGQQLSVSLRGLKKGKLLASGKNMRAEGKAAKKGPPKGKPQQTKAESQNRPNEDKEDGNNSGNGGGKGAKGKKTSKAAEDTPDEPEDTPDEPEDQPRPGNQPGPPGPPDPKSKKPTTNKPALTQPAATPAISNPPPAPAPTPVSTTSQSSSTQTTSSQENSSTTIETSQQPVTLTSSTVQPSETLSTTSIPALSSISTTDQFQTTSSSSVGSETTSLISLTSSTTSSLSGGTSDSILVTLSAPASSGFSTSTANLTPTSTPNVGAEALAPNGISSSRSSMDPKTMAGVIIASLVGASILFFAIMFCIRLALHRKHDEHDLNSPPLSPPRYRISYSTESGPENTAAMEEARPANLVLPRSSTMSQRTAGTGDILTAETANFQTTRLTSNPISRSIIRADGTIKTIIKSMPRFSWSSRSQETLAKPPTQQLPPPMLHSKDLYLPEKHSSFLKGDWPEHLNEQQALSLKLDMTSGSKSGSRVPENMPTNFDIMGTDERGKAEKKTSLLLEEDAARWSDPFSLDWRRSGGNVRAPSAWKAPPTWG